MKNFLTLHLWVVISCCVIIPLQAMVYDNRFMPLYARNYSKVFDSLTCTYRQSALIPDLFLMTGSESFADDEDNDQGLFDMFGRFDQGKLANAIIDLGNPNPFDVPGLNPLKYTDQEIIWLMDGKIETQGIALQYDQHLGCYLSTGFSLFFMHLFSRNFFSLSPKTIGNLNITPEEALRLDQVRRDMNNTLSILAPKYTAFGFSDIDWYLRFGNIWEYSLKCKRIDAGARVGVLIPSGKTRVLNNPSSIPFGGNGHWGAYVAGDLEIEIKEDWIFGLLLRVNKRFAKTKLARIPIAQEQELWGAVVGPLKVDPGSTVVFSPYIRFEGLRDGFGVQAQYTLVAHDDDEITDKRTIQQPPATLKNVNKFSRWAAEYFTIDAFYDFAKVRLPFSFAPLVSLKWDIPIKMLGIAKDAAKTNRLSLGIVFRF